ncbi:hypothetical protein EVG20_g10003 [Dentipellis fragilis]|uniref:Uncharacterized protein n=1 Tax=Dentipellis fragilis TaxID=205917 RepID=A0A4Y9XX27_9AGAM|nr:hypothetical protein EVG20_g10003 [Dentipellis fragilis]
MARYALSTLLALASSTYVTAQAIASTPLAGKSFAYPSQIPYHVDPQTDGRGPQFGYNQCNSTTEGPTSDCQTSFVSTIDDFCLWAPAKPDSTIADTEGEEVAWCTKKGHGTRIIPAGALQGVQYIKTDNYIQIAGFIDQTLVNIQDGDYGGELDPHGQDLRGNPMSGLMYSTGYSKDNSTVVQMHEWNLGGEADASHGNTIPKGLAVLKSVFFRLIPSAFNGPGESGTGCLCMADLKSKAQAKKIEVPHIRLCQLTLSWRNPHPKPPWFLAEQAQWLGLSSGMTNVLNDTVPVLVLAPTVVSCMYGMIEARTCAVCLANCQGDMHSHRRLTVSPDSLKSDGTPIFLAVEEHYNRRLPYQESFIGGGTFCITICPDDGAAKNAAGYCRNTLDRLGCAVNSPNNAQNGTFEVCDGEDKDLPGVYTTNGQTVTYWQPDESLGPITTIPFTVRTPASSNCKTFSPAALFADAPGASAPASASVSGAAPTASASASGAAPTASGSSAAPAAPGGSSSSAGSPSRSSSADSAAVTGGAASTGASIFAALVGVAFSVAFLADHGLQLNVYPGLFIWDLCVCGYEYWGLRCEHDAALADVEKSPSRTGSMQWATSCPKDCVTSRRFADRTPPFPQKTASHGLAAHFGPSSITY